MKVLFYAINGIGLGHLNKMMLVAREIREMRPDWSILFITNSEYAEWLFRNGYQYIKLPLNDKDLSIAPSQKIIPLHYYNQFAMSALDFYMPDVIVYDAAFPGDVAAYANSIGIKNVFVMRKDKDSHLLSVLSWKLLDKFDYICMPYSKKEFLELGATPKILGALKKRNVQFIGPLVRLPTKAKKTEKNGLTIVVAAGGGGWHDAEELLRSAYDACKKLLTQHPSISCRIFTGPLFSGSIQSDDSRIGVEKFSDDFLEILRNADIVVSQAGYSSCNEIVMAKTPAILFPGFRLNEDTLARARRLEEKGIAITTEKPKEIYQKLNQVLENRAAGLKRMQKRFSRIKIVPGNKRLASKIVRLGEKTCFLELGRQSILRRVFENVVFSGDSIGKVARLAAIVKKRGFKVIQLHSNSEALSNEKKLKSLVDAGINSFRIDFYGSRGKTHNALIGRRNNFAHMVLAAKIIGSRKIHLVASCNVLDKNLKELPGLVKLLFSLGIFHVDIRMPQQKTGMAKEMLAIRRICGRAEYRSRIITFSKSANSPEVLNAKRCYQAMVDYYSLLLARLDSKKIAIMQKSVPIEVLAEIDREIDRLRKRLMSEYADNNEIEVGIYLIDRKMASILPPKKKKKFDMLKEDLRALEKKKEALLAKNWPVLAEGFRKGMKGGNKAQRLIGELSEIEDSISVGNRKTVRLAGKKYGELKRLQENRAKVNEQVRKHYNEKVRWLKRRLMEILGERYALLKKKSRIIASIENRQRTYEREISILKKRREGW